MKRESNLGIYMCWFCSLFVILVSLGIIIYLIFNGISYLDWDFLTIDPDFGQYTMKLRGGILSPMIGTILLTSLSILFALPWAVSMAVYLVEYADNYRWPKILRLGINVLAGVPTIVIALFSLIVFSYPQMAFLSMKVEGVQVAKAFGRSFLVASIAMGIMVLPYITRAVDEALRSVPQTYREAAYSLGTSKWRMIRRVVLPMARPGIASGAILGIGRISADIAIVSFCLGGTLTFSSPKPWWTPDHWLSTLRGAGGTLTSFIYYASPVGQGSNADRAFSASLVLVVFILAINLIVNLLQRSSSVKRL